MLTLLQMSLQAFVALTFLSCLLSMTTSVNTIDSLTDQPSADDMVMPFYNKRESGADPWSLCPNSMERVDCFLEYLRVYARLRKATSGSNSVSVRNIGKRVSYTNTKSTQCPDGFDSNLCLLVQLQTYMNDLNREGSGRRESLK